MSDFSYGSDRLFRGVETPSDPKTPLVLEKWTANDSITLRVGSTLYLLNIRRLPVLDVHAIDKEGKVIDLPGDW